ncbi:hypothetical protein Pmani_008544 [Petrolisthes manimaculis]|uniref:Pentatricopeptide repeat-containing protein-mitochondrial domain-containing protein n=1 Tax=Petrolisthes manimaculis TaxID=1843537 RepID=A0AAE1Q6R9_9EUCA|nr:hypothetical protein Pmani_008544 [Petrolisthes manimaculis]
MKERYTKAQSFRDEVDGNDYNTFGRLAALSQETKGLSISQESKKGKNGRHFHKLENPTVTGIKLESEDNVGSARNEAVLEKWNNIINSRGREILNRTVVQDDSEDDFHILIQKGRTKDNNHSNKNHIQKTGNLQNNFTSRNTNERTPSDLKSTLLTEESYGSSLPLCTEENLEIFTQSRLPEKFGTLSPIRVDFENVEGDEGDKAAEAFEEARLRRKHSPVYYGNQMKKLCKEKKLNEALHILEVEMPEVRAKPNEYCYNVLINACGKVGYTKKAFQLYNQLKKRGLKVQDVVYTGLFNACANSPWLSTDGLQRATHLRSQLIEKGYPVNKTSSHAMIKAFGRCGDIKTAFQIVDDMLSQGLLVTTETLNFLLQACITDTISGFRHAIMVWRKMRRLNLLPDIYSYNLLVQCTAQCKAGESAFTSDLLLASPMPQEHQQASKNIKKSKKTSSAKKVLLVETKHEPEAKNYEPTNGRQEGGAPEVIVGENHPVSQVSNKNVLLDEQLYPKVEVEREANVSEGTTGSVMFPSILGQTQMPGAVVALNSLEQAQDRLALLGGPVGLLEQMITDGVKPDLKTVTQMLNSLPSDIQTEEALLSSMKNMGLEPDTQLCNMLIRKRSMRGDTQAAKDVLEVIQDYHLVPDIVTFGCLALGCNNLSDATQLLADMDRAQFRPNLEIMAMLTRNGLVKGNYFFALEMLREMKKRDIQPDEKLLAVLEDSRIRARSLILKQEGKKSRGLKNRQIEGARVFLLEYKMWLKSSGVQLSDHPWAQYQPQRQTVMEDQQNEKPSH